MTEQTSFTFIFLLNLLQLGVWPHRCYQTAHLRAPHHVTWLITPSFLETFFHLASWTSQSPGFPLTSLSLTLSSVSLFEFFLPYLLYSEILYSSSFCFLFGWFFTQNYHYKTPMYFIIIKYLCKYLWTIIIKYLFIIFVWFLSKECERFVFLLATDTSSTSRILLGTY